MTTEIKLTGLVLCYDNKKMMETVFQRLKDLKLQEVDVKKSWNPAGAQYPWAVAVICKDKKKLDEVDGILVEKKVLLGGADLYAGEERILEFIRMLPLDTKFKPGIARIAAGECPIFAKSPMACQFCPVGHVLECHYPKNCDEAKCSHRRRNTDGLDGLLSRD